MVSAVGTQGGAGAEARWWEKGKKKGEKREKGKERV